ncbi:MAG: DNA-binding protein [Lachnospiraceae bacterium]|nr:DNA-binding protein [Lachnospiraceae bacterium]
MESIVKQALLYDFYGELLTEHQKSVYEDYILNDIGLSEIALERGISRQGVHDLVKRCGKILEGYEEKLHLVEKFLKAKDEVANIEKLAIKLEETKDIELVKEITKITQSILEEM